MEYCALQTDGLVHLGVIKNHKLLTAICKPEEIPVILSNQIIAMADHAGSLYLEEFGENSVIYLALDCLYQKSIR